MIKEIKQILKEPVRTYKAYVRRTATQIQTIDVELIGDKFNEKEPNYNNYIYNVQISPIVILYGEKVTIKRPKVNEYVIITKTDGNRWITIVGGDEEIHTLGKNEMVIKTADGQSFDISNIDGITLNKTTKLGNQDSDDEQLTIILNGILFKVADANANYDTMSLEHNYLGFNSVLRQIEISQLTSVNNDELAKINQSIHNTKAILTNNIYTNFVKIAYNTKYSDGAVTLLNYIIWFLKKYPNKLITINNTFVDEFSKTITYQLLDRTYSKFFLAKNLYAYFEINYNMPTADKVFNFLASGNVNLGALINNSTLEKLGKYFFGKKDKNYLDINFYNTNLLYLNPTQSLALAIKSIWSYDNTNIITTNIADDYLSIAQRIYPFQYNIFEKKFNSLTKSLNQKLTSWSDISLIIFGALYSYYDVRADIIGKQSNSNYTANLGNIIEDMINTLQNRTITITTSNGAVTASLVNGYYEPNKTLNKTILKVY